MYKDYINEASYKNIVKNVPNTDSNLAWYEEDGKVIPRIDADFIWQDAKYIPEKPKDDEFYCVIGQENVLIYKKYTLVLNQVENLNTTFYNEKFNNIIVTQHYHVELFDNENNQIPFGLNKWSYDSNNGYLSFIDGFPEGYQLPLKVTFYRYEGRFLNETILKNDGSVQLSDNYEPKEKQDIATKSYIDKELKKTNNIVDKIIPPKPKTLDNVDLEFVCDKVFSAFDVKTGDFVENVIIRDYDFKIVSPLFYNPNIGKIHILLNGFIAESIDLKNIRDTNDIKILFNGDYYYDTTASRSFYDGLKFEFHTRPEKLPVFYTNDYYIKIQFQYEYNTIKETSKPIIIGIEDKPVENAIKSHFKLRPDNYKWRFVSGVPTPVVGSIIKIENLKTNTLRGFKSNNKIGDFEITNEQYEILPKNSYGVYIPEEEYITDYIIKSGWYYENLLLNAKSYNIFGKQNGTYNEMYYFRCDTISDESNRVFSGNGLFPLDYGKNWSSEKDLSNTNELMMVNNKWQWPVDNYSINGSNISSLTQWDATWIKQGPDYSKVSKNGIKYATFKFDIPLSNGVYITVPEFEKKKNIKCFNIESCQIKVEGFTEWLNANKPYKGVGTVSKKDEGCLAVQNCTDDTIYCTFGPKPIFGKLYIRFGLKYSNFKFSTPKIVTNI